MKQKLILFFLPFLLTLSACGISQADYDALAEENRSLMSDVESLSPQVESDTKASSSDEYFIDNDESLNFDVEDESTWEFATNNYPYVTYDEIQTIVVPLHGKDVPIGLLNNILKEAGLK